MSVLILLSAFFSGSEAALFSLTRSNRKRLARSGPGGRVADSLLQDPDRLLSAILVLEPADQHDVFCNCGDFGFAIGIEFAIR